MGVWYYKAYDSRADNYMSGLLMIESSEPDCINEELCSLRAKLNASKYKLVMVKRLTKSEYLSLKKSIDNKPYKIIKPKVVSRLIKLTIFVVLSLCALYLL